MALKLPTVSIIMPCYNAAPYLAESITSCLNQESDPLELVIVDDGSSDSSLTLISWFERNEPRIRVIRLSDNHGPAYAMNRGIEAASGDVVCFAAADDIQEPNKVRTLQEAFGKDIDFCYTGYYHASVKGQVHSEIHPKPLTVENIKAADCASGGAIAMRRHVARSVPFREELRLNEDQGLIIDLYKAGFKYAVVDVPTFRYRLLKTGLSYGRKQEVQEITRRLNQEL